MRVLLALVVLAGLLYWGADTRDRFEVGVHLAQHSRDPFKMDADTGKVTSLMSEAESSGLVKGATITSLNGAPFTGRAQWEAISNPGKPGALVFVGFERPDGSIGSSLITLVAAQPQPGTPRGPGEMLQQFALFGILPFLCMLIGYWVVFAKPREWNAWLLLVLLLFPEVVFGMGTGLATGGWLVFREVYWYALQTLGPLALLLFAIYFPERSRVDIDLPWLKWVVIGPALLCAAVVFRQIYGQFYLAGNPSWLIHIVHWTDRIENALNLMCVVLYLIIIFRKMQSASTEDARRRLRVLLAGTSVGLGALLVAFVLLPDLGYSPSAHGHLWVAYAGSALFMLAPLTLAYVVLVQRAMDVRILVRQGTKYALARATVWGVQIALVVAVSYRLLLPLLTQEQVSRNQLWQGAIFLLLIAVIGFVFRKKSTNWVDKKFFREAYDSERVLKELSEEVRKFTESEPLLLTVLRCVAETLHVNQIAVFLHGRAGFTLKQAIGISLEGAGPFTLASNSSTIRNLTNTNSPAQLYREEPDAWYLMAAKSERRTLDELGAELFLPLSGRNRLMGVMALGPKQSEAAYSKSDLHLLQALANQTGMALELSELAHSLANEAALRERANREMEIAREVQERLFPQEMPLLAGVSIAGACRPALGVGGDYYDVFTLQDGRLGLAIGDVSGKGISAALLMASLRASLRGVTIDNPREFAKLMDKVNRLVYEASADNRYATFFFGAFDPATRVLECVNAGHNAPLVLRQQSDGSFEILRLEADGPVVGLLPFAVYTEQSLRLEPGDLLVSYTDGISEAMTHDDEEWGEERMMAAAAAAKGCQASEVLQAVFAEADKFTAGAPQHDDMTLLILKLDLPGIDDGCVSSLPEAPSTF